MSVKNILWFDDKKGENDIVKYFNKYQEQVNYVDSFDEFFDQVNSMNIYNYDLIVLDVDLTELSEVPDKNGKSDKDNLKDNMRSCVTITNDDDIDIEKSAGVLIYLYLALNRYPRDRICFLTGNNKQYIEDVFNKCYLSMPPATHIKEKGHEPSRNSHRPVSQIDWSYFYEVTIQIQDKEGKKIVDNSFFQFRYILRNMCIVLIDWLEWLKLSPCPENNPYSWKNKKIKYNRECTNATHDISEFLMMVKSVKNRLYNIKPISDEEKKEVYIDIVNGITSLAECFSMPYKERYCSILKIIRNTMAHKPENLKNDIDSKLCIFICMIGFRIYFDFSKFSTFSEYKDYEYVENKALQFITGSSIPDNYYSYITHHENILIGTEENASRFFEYKNPPESINTSKEIYQIYSSIYWSCKIKHIKFPPERKLFLDKCTYVILNKIESDE